ncbi:GNAT family N-acetyltransferase [Streptomyces sp. SID5785]|uniref:GNAT family N-acetyltransferase n=1 Tax=Streptomyces sp. SID5785 TaxID=2690309 RepID=UPI00136119CA|nr:GNAT family N-acetyltransferase [Streptomyces sp. SID5785]MZD06308.1 GNAT family N-acetyltransferase [Streptomyces sp. SID5785]
MEPNDTRRGGAPVVTERAAADLPVCAEVLGAVHRKDGYPVNWPADPVGWLRVDGELGAWVARLAGRPVGHVVLAGPGPGDVAPRLAPAGGPTAVVGRLFVDPAARGRRIGALLLDRVAHEARLRGARAVLDVVPSDVAAVALYERAGWQFLGTGQQEWGPDELIDVRCYAAPAPPARDTPGARDTAPWTGDDGEDHR